MLQVAIIGLGTLGVRMLEELSQSGAETIVIDKDENIIQKYKDFTKYAFATDVINAKALETVLPSDIDAAIIDMGSNFEATIMTTNNLHKLGIKKIIVEADNDEQGEILKLVGATQIVFPEEEAARRITPLLLTSVLHNFMPITSDFALCEIDVCEELYGKKLTDSNLRNKWNLNVVAYRKSERDDFSFINSPNFEFRKEYTLLVAGQNEDISNYLTKFGNNTSLTNVSLISRMFKKH